MKKKQKNDEQYIKNPSEPDEKADELNENGPTSEKRTDSIIETGSTSYRWASHSAQYCWR